MDFRITGLPLARFRALFALDSQRLKEMGIERVVVRDTPGFPDRITLDDVKTGESVLLMNYTHQDAATPFRSSHAIYVSESATRTWDRENEIPPALARRMLSLRAFDRDHRMVDADLVEGSALPALIAQFFHNDDVAYLHVHYAKRGCFAARVDRV